MKAAQTIRERAERILEDEDGLFMVDVKLKGNLGSQHLKVMLDGEQGVTIDQCSSVSRKLGNVLEEEDLIKGKYNLEVSSAGVDTPLTMERQYPKHVGRDLKIWLKDGNEVKGTLNSVDEKSIELVIDSSTQKINFEEIDKSKVIVSFK